MVKCYENGKSMQNVKNSSNEFCEKFSIFLKLFLD